MTSTPLTDESPWNWCHMPPEIKMECIKHCGVKERLLLRATARTERALVDAKKTEIPLLRVSFGTYRSKISTGPHVNELTALRYPWTENNPTPCLELLLKTSRIGIFQLASTSCRSLTRGFVDRDAKYSVEIFQHNTACKQDLVFFLNALDSEKIQWIQMNGDDVEDMPTIEEMVKIPNLINCSYWQISNYHGTDSAVTVAQTWIDMNARIGMRFQVLALEEGTVEEFVCEFEDQIVYQANNLIRIHTNDPKKHIILELGHHAVEAESFRGGIIFKRLQFLRLLMVSADSENSDQEEWGQTVTWMNWLCPGYEFPYESIF